MRGWEGISAAVAYLVVWIMPGAWYSPIAFGGLTLMTKARKHQQIVESSVETNDNIPIPLKLLRQELTTGYNKLSNVRPSEIISSFHDLLMRRLRLQVGDANPSQSMSSGWQFSASELSSFCWQQPLSGLGPRL